MIAGRRLPRSWAAAGAEAVVEAKREDWTTDPFQFLEKDGYFYGRGAGDDKAKAAIWVANLIRYKREGFTPDIIVALTAGEEGGGPFEAISSCSQCWLRLVCCSSKGGDSF